MIDLDLASKIAGPILGGLVTKILGDLISKRPQVICFYGHSSGVNLAPDPTTKEIVRVHHHSVVVANKGRETAKNVRLGHSILPNFDVFPATEYSRNLLPGGSEEILLPSLMPGEQITINYLYFFPTTYDRINTYVKSDAGHAKVLKVLPTPQWPRWALVGAWCLIAYGMVALIYTLVVTLRGSA